MQDKKQYFSLAIAEEARDSLNKLAKLYKLTQSEVIETLISTASMPYTIELLEKQAAEKERGRRERNSNRQKLRKAISALSEEELNEILKAKGIQ